MWDPEHFPGADNVPWPLLIRARYQFEVDAIVASVIVRNVAALGTAAIAEEIGLAAAKAVAVSREVNGRKKVVIGVVTLTGVGFKVSFIITGAACSR